MSNKITEPILTLDEVHKMLDKVDSFPDEKVETDTTREKKILDHRHDKTTTGDKVTKVVRD
jgi:Asp-tRNA(Asn)/Glu-tRNA(Gln) amidotransferase C subunit